MTKKNVIGLMEDMVEAGIAKTFHFGRSVIERKVMFCTVDLTGGGKLTGEGASLQEAITNALNTEDEDDLI